MKLLKCPKCGELFSDSYKECPFCAEDEELAQGGKARHGRRIQRQKSPSIGGPVLVIVIVFLAAFLVYAFFGDKISSLFEKTDKPSVEDVTPAPSPTPDTSATLTLDQQTLTLVEGGSTKLTVSGAENCIWTSSNTAAATVSDDGTVTAVGGGILRDVILGITPPLAFRDPTCTLVAVGVSLLLCIPWVRHSLMHNHRLFDVSLLLMDSVGLGVFTVMGIWNAMDFSPDRSTYLLVFVGLLTGVGGGVMRDVLAGNTPYILVKHVYACASLAGAVLCAVLWRLVPQYVAMLAGMTTVLLIRLLSAHFRWNLPRVEDETL
mgnify:CR=1 FL=1